jgi:hypothetical protein
MSRRWMRLLLALAVLVPLALSGCATLDETARVGLPAQQAELVGRQRGRRGHAGRLDRIRLEGPASRCAARPVAAAAACRRAAAAVPAWRALGRARQRASACAACTNWVLRCWASTTAASARAPTRCRRKAWPMKTRAPPGTGWADRTPACRATCSAIRWAAPSPCSWRLGRRRERRARRRLLHLGARRGQQFQVGLAAGGPADHAALRRRRARRQAGLAAAGGARQPGPADPARAGPRAVRACADPKRFVLVEGGSHHNTNSVGQTQYREALSELFGLRLAGEDARLVRAPSPTRAN